MARPTYAQQLKDPRWQKRRLEILSKADFRCVNCDAKDKTLHVHHKIYRKGCLAWEYADEDLESLCEDCHEFETLVRAELNELLGRLSSGEIEQLVGYAKAMIVQHACDDEREHAPITVRSAEEADGLGDGLGLEFAESYRILASPEPFSVSTLFRIGVAASRRRIARDRRGESASSMEDLFEKDAALEMPPRPRE